MSLNVNAYYCTFSTICQTLAGAFAILVAIVLHQIQDLRRKLAEECRDAYLGRGISDEALIDADRDDNWQPLIDDLRSHPLPSDEHSMQEGSWKIRNRNEEGFFQHV